MKQVIEMVRVLETSTLPVVLWTLQNQYFELLRHLAPSIRAQAGSGDAESARWTETFATLGEVLRVATPAPRAAAAD
jgi:hypothetical protein